MRRKKSAKTLICYDSSSNDSDNEPLSKKVAKRIKNDDTKKNNNEDSSSESDIETYLKKPDQIDLNSSFFNLEKTSEESSFDKIEKNIFEGVSRLSDSEDEEENVDKVETARSTDEIASTSKLNFQQLHDFTKKIEEARKHVELYNAKKKMEEKQLDISKLLEAGESKLHNDNELDLKVSLHSSEFESCSEEEGWEEVKDNQKEKIIPKEGLQITVELPNVMKKKKGTDLLASIKRRFNRIKKENQILVHKVHLLCWIAYGNYVSSMINSQEVLGMALSLLPSQQCYPSERTDLTYLEQILKWYHKTVVNLEKPVPRNLGLDDLLSLQVKKRAVYNNKMLVFLFVAILRSLGIQCRVVFSFQTVPLRPPSSELHSLSTKTEENNIGAKKELKKQNKKKIEASTSKDEKDKRSDGNRTVKSTNVSEKKSENKADGAGNKNKNQKVVKRNKTENENKDQDCSKTNKKEEENKNRKFSKVNESKSRKSLKINTKVDNNKIQKSCKTNEKEDATKNQSSLKLDGRTKNCKSLSSTEEKSESQLNDKKLKSAADKTSSNSMKNTKATAKASRPTRSHIKSDTPNKIAKTPQRNLRSKIVPQLDGMNDSTTDEESIPQLDGATTDTEKRAKKPNLRKLKQIKKSPRSQKVIKYKDSDSEDDFVSNTTRSNNKKEPPKPPNLKKLKQLDVRDDIIKLVKGRITEHRKAKGSSDDDSDYVPMEIKKKHHDSGDEFAPKVKRRIPVKSRKVLSSDEEDEDENKKRKGVDVWAEVFLESEEKWISVDIVKAQVHCVSELYRRATHPIAYVVAWNNNNSLKDITRRYCQNFNTVTRKLRVDNQWWEATLKTFLGPQTARDREENEELEKQQLEKPLPTSIAEYKNHPLYVLRRHLLKFEAIYPSDAAILGFVRNEPVYSRQCVYTLHSRDIWLKHAKVVKPGEKPYKIVKARPKYDKLSNTIITDQNLEIFGPWQTEDYIPPTAENGVVPRNAFGNVELFKDCMLPKKTVHLRLPGLNKVAKKLNIDCAPAVVGFDFHSGWSHPTFDGFVVCEEYADTLTLAWEQEQEEIEKREREKIEKRVYENWRKLIKGLLIRERLKAKYEFGEFSGGNKKRAKGPKLIAKKKRICSDSESD